VEEESIDSDASYGGDDSLIENEMNWEYESPLDEGCPILGLKEALAQKSNSDGPFFQELWGLLGEEGQKGLMKSFGEAERQQNESKFLINNVN
jgi:hypothetical protein